MTHLDDRTIQLTQAELNALPEWRSAPPTEGAMFRTQSTGLNRVPVLVKIVKTPPMFNLERVWYQVSVVSLECPAGSSYPATSHDCVS